MDQVPTGDVVDTVGAGDAYTAILATGILDRWPPKTILKRATEFAGAVCTLQGAIPEDSAFYDPYLPWTKEGGNGH
jgi:fructokinase